MPDTVEPMPGLRISTWTKTIPSPTHPERDEDTAWSAANGIAHAVIDGMGGSRRVVNGREIGGEHAAAMIREVLEARLQNLPADLGIEQARELLGVVVAEAGGRIYKELNASGQIPPEQIPADSSAEQVMVAAVMTGLIFCEGGHIAVTGQNGDTRAYLFSEGELVLITEDEDAVQLDMAQGKITADEAATIQEELDAFDGLNVEGLHPLARPYFAQRNLVFGQIGDAPAPRTPEFSSIDVRPGDKILLCSDGVYANLTTNEITNALSAVEPAAALTDRSLARAVEPNNPDPNDTFAPYNYRAHADDITAIVIKLDW